MNQVKAAAVRTLLREYLAKRVLFYTTRDMQEHAQLDSRTTRLQSALWSAVVALVVAGMNDVLNAQVYAQAAPWLTDAQNLSSLASSLPTP